ncbi:GNAT family N-acetyltransferase [Aerococcaceae bacterium WGS1372]
MVNRQEHSNQDFEEIIETIFRVAQPKDAKAIIGLLNEVAKESPYLTLNPEGVDTTVDEQVELIRRYNESNHSIMLVAESDDQIVGMATVYAIDNYRQKHVGEIGVSIVHEYWGYGIGSILTEELIEFARQSGMKVLTLEVVTENKRAINLYEKYGFNIVGTLSKRLRHNYHYFDTFVMELMID